MNFIYALLLGLLALVPVAFAQEVSRDDLAADNHYVIKCNFTNVEAEPVLQSLVADAEWTQVVYQPRTGEVFADKNINFQLEMKKTTPVSYIWTFATKAGETKVRIQELLTEPVRFTLLGRKPGTYECYRQFSSKIFFYKRF